MKKLFPTIVLLTASVSCASAADGAVSPSAYTLTEVFGLPITNSMLTGWVISISLILGIRLAIGKAQLVPSKGQAVVESVTCGLRDNIFEPIVGKKMIGPTFPLLIGLFLFVLIHNWSGLIPGVGAFGSIDDGHLNYWFRPANSDLNTTLALGLIASVIGWIYFVLRYAGIKTLFHDIFGNKADPNGMPKIIYLLLFPLFFLVGIIELISIALRPVSLSVRLYGNVFGGENLLATMTTQFGFLNYILPVPFYFLEMLIGAVQALVFALLTAVYIGLICNHDDGSEKAH